MYVESLKLSNMKAIAGAEMEFRIPVNPGEEENAPGHNVTLLLGDNGTGKTTILGSIALAVLSRVLEGSGYRPYHLVRHGQQEAFTLAQLRLGPEDTEAAHERPVLTETHLRLLMRGDYPTMDAKSWPEHEGAKTEASSDESLWNGIYDDRGSGFLLLAYGSTRRVERSESFDPSSQQRRRSVRYHRVASLFEDHMAMAPLAGWLPKVAPVRQKMVVDLISDALPSELEYFGEQNDDGQYLFEQNGIAIPFGALSDGYRQYIGLITDIVYNLNLVCEPSRVLFDLPGVVLIDEIDLHLHPDWQRLLLPKLSRVFPRLQFILTSHSPIIAGTVRSKNLIILERTEEGTVNARRSKESIFGRSADEILLSGHFGLKTTRAEGADNRLQALARDAMEGDMDAAVRYMELLAPAEGEPAFEEEPITEGGDLEPLKRRRRETRRRIEWTWYPYGAFIAGFGTGALVLGLVWLLLG